MAWDQPQFDFSKTSFLVRFYARSNRPTELDIQLKLRCFDFTMMLYEASTTDLPLFCWHLTITRHSTPSIPRIGLLADCQKLDFGINGVALVRLLLFWIGRTPYVLHLLSVWQAFYKQRSWFAAVCFVNSTSRQYRLSASPPFPLVGRWYSA